MTSLCHICKGKTIRGSAEFQGAKPGPRRPQAGAGQRGSGRTVLALALAMAAALSAHAQSPGPCGLDGTAARVAAVEPGLELRLADGRRVRLAGIDPPLDTPARPARAAETQASLAAWLVGRDILLRPLEAVADRWNRLAALVFATTAPSSAEPSGAEPARLSVAEALLDAGLARAKPESAIHACYAIFLQLEAQARAARLGLWADPFYAVLSAEDVAGLTAHTGGMVLVEGSLRLRTGRFRTYVTLSQGHSAFAASATPRILKLLSKAGLGLRDLVGRSVRIRGFLDDRFGLRIDLTSPDQIEVLSRDAAAPSPQDKTQPP